eukprot:6213395-Pleurochrysis_carterae.AAC.2
MNAVLKKFGQGLHFAEHAKKRDQRPQGNHARALLTRKELIAKLITNVYGEVNTAEAISAMEDLRSTSVARPSAAPAPPKPAARKKKRREAVSLGGFTTRTNSNARGPSARPPLPIQPQPTAAEATSQQSAAAASRQCATAAPSQQAQQTTSTDGGENGSGGGGGDDDDNDNENEDFDEEDDEYIPELGAFATSGGLASALRVWQTCVKLNEQLHFLYDDRSSLDERERIGSLNEKKGRAWALAVRNHTGNTVASNYMHMSFAHLKELTIRHGMFSRVDDEILERDNRTTGRICQNLLFWGGSSDPAGAAQTRHVMRPVLDAEGQETGEFREVAVVRKRNPGQSEQFARLLLGRMLLRSKRKLSSQSEATSALKALEAQVRAEARAAVKADIDDKLEASAAAAEQ